MRRGLAIAALVVVVFGLVGALTFPTDAIVQAVLDRVPLPDRMQLTFAGAHLRPNGLRLEQVHVIRASGQPAFDAEWLRLWPSLWGLWRDGTGRPWSIAAGTCQGTIDVDIGAEATRTPIAVALEHVEVASCLPYVMPQVQAHGRIEGRFRVSLGTVDPHLSEGTLELRGAAWKPGGPLEDTTLRADAGSLTWMLAEHRFELTKLEATSSDFRASGSGLVRLLPALDDSVIDLRVTITPGPTMPPLLQRYLDAVPGTAPDAQGARTFRIQGPLRHPSATAVPPAPSAGTLPSRVR